MECLEVCDVRGSHSDDMLMQSSTSCDVIENFKVDATFEKFILDDFDSYMDDINVRLTISRMVTDAVTKGMVNAIKDEAADKVASKEAEVAYLKEKLLSYETSMHGNGESGLGMAVGSKGIEINRQLAMHDFSVEYNDIGKNLSNLKIEMEEQFCRLRKQLEDVKGNNSIGGTHLSSIEQEKMLEESMEMNKCFDSLHHTFGIVYEHINYLITMSKELLYQGKWESEFQAKVNGFVFQSVVSCLREDFERRSLEQGHLYGVQYKKVMAKINELSSFRQELDAISRSLSIPEQGKLSSHGSHEFSEDWNNVERKDRIHRMVLGNHHLHSSSGLEENDSIESDKSKEPKSTSPGSTDSSLLSMPKEQIIAYFKDKMTKMKRNHESVVQEKTEEYYRLKREYLREKDPSNWRKDKEFDSLRKSIPEVIVKLDDILVEYEKSTMVCDNSENGYSLKVKTDSLRLENQCLQAMLMEKTKEVECLSSQVSNAADKMSYLSTVEANLLQRMEKLKCDIEDASFEASIREEVYESIIEESCGKIECDITVDIETFFTHEICMIVFKESIQDAKAVVDNMTLRHIEEKERRAYTEAMLLESDKALVLATDENETLKHENTLLSGLIEEKEKSVLEMTSKLVEKEEHSELLCKELNALEDQANQQERLLNGRKKELDSTRTRLEEALEKINLYEIERGKLEQTLKEAVVCVKELETQNQELHSVIQDKQNIISTGAANELALKKQLKSFIIYVRKLLKEVVDCESRMMEKFVLNSSRIKMLNDQFGPLVQQANSLKKKGLLYKQGLEVKCSDLQKAESEVDLLGDQVEALLGLLGKIYIALDHYSPILQHYPGVMETLELIRRAIEGETSKPV